jgi:hypothetical protein
VKLQFCIQTEFFSISECHCRSFILNVVCVYQVRYKCMNKEYCNQITHWGNMIHILKRKCVWNSQVLFVIFYVFPHTFGLSHHSSVPWMPFTLSCIHCFIPIFSVQHLFKCDPVCPSLSDKIILLLAFMPLCAPTVGIFFLFGFGVVSSLCVSAQNSKMELD